MTDDEDVLRAVRVDALGGVTVRLEGATSDAVRRRASTLGLSVDDYVARLIERDAHHEDELRLLAEEQERAQDA